MDGQFTTTTKEETPCIYAIINNENQRVYVGESKTPTRRYKQHIIGLKRGIHANKGLQDDFNKGHSFTFYRLRDYGEDETETMRYYELKYMDICRKRGFELYNTETDKQINDLLYCNSHEWEIHCLMVRKRDEYYRKYFCCTFNQFMTYGMLAKDRESPYSYFHWRIKDFYKNRMEEIEKEEQEKRKQFLREHKKISFYIKKDIYEKVKEISENPEEYINMLVEKSISNAG